MREDKIRNYIFNELSKLNFKKETKGFKYLNEAIYLSIIDENTIENLSKNVFQNIAKKFNARSPENVKWCMNRVIDTMYCNTNMKDLCKYFNLEEDQKPTLKFIIYFITCKFFRNNNYK